ncbi:MAG: glycoside hydrolase family 15 protein [Bacteroidota bacterium]
MADLLSVSLDLLASQQTASGAFIASLHFPVYRYCWLRDASFISHALDRAGEHGAARRFHRWAAAALLRQRDKVDALRRKLADGLPLCAGDFLPTRYREDGSPEDDDWPNFQLDGYGTWLWALADHLERTGAGGPLEELGPAIRMVLDYLGSCWRIPNYDCWEEHGNRVHTSTLACLAGGIRRIGALSGAADALLLAEEIADYLRRHCVVDGRLIKFTTPSEPQVRVAMADINATSSPEVGREVDASLLWAAVPFRVLAPDEPLMRRTVAEIERTLYRRGGVHRYAGDTYYGGGLWVLLTAWLGWYYAVTGCPEKARRCLAWVEAQADERGFLPEQVSEDLNDAALLPYWVERWGPSARPLLWSHAMYIVLKAELQAGSEEASCGCILDEVSKKA